MESDKPTLEDIYNAPDELPGASDDSDVDWRSEFTRLSEKEAATQIELNRYKDANRTAEILDGLIEPFANKSFIFMCGYCGFVGLIILMNSFGCFRNQISDSVLRILVGSTAVTVIGLVGMVLTGIFVGARRKSY